MFNTFKQLINVQYLFNLTQIKKICLFALTFLVFFHFLKDSFIVYYYLLAVIVTLSVVVLLFEKKLPKINYDFKLMFILISFIIYLFVIVIISLAYQDRWSVTSQDLWMGFGRLLITPLFIILLCCLIESKQDFIKIANFYVILFIIGFISIYIQNIYGHIPFFGNSYYGESLDGSIRYGTIGYSSTIGSVVTYGACFFTAVLIVFLQNNLNPFFKGVLISIIFSGAILSMSKAAFINIFLTLLIMSVFIGKNQNWKVFLSILICMAFFILSITNLYDAFVALLTNTTGFEIKEGSLNEENYIPIYERFLSRLSLNNVELFSSIKDYLFGIGTYGGGGVFMANNLYTSHNSYLDIYTIGGILFIVITISLMAIVQFKLAYLYFASRDILALIFLLSNSLLFLNMLIFNGALFHPLVSFSFWISLVYVLKINTFKLSDGHVH